ncbi:MAG: Holliday junction resolvase RuvX [Alphaproteobacteria bacterium]|nr:Holliday junction resolvase RuvX [Alphaproteobacteria bacterium]
MPLILPQNLKETLKVNQRLLGLDLGEKTIGLALSDTRCSVASPYTTIQRTKFKPNAREIKNIIDAQDVQAIILGMPLNMNGTEGPRCQSTRQFATNFLSLYDMPLALWDERLSTKAAEGAMIHFDLSRKQRAEKIDKAAASFILQGFLDFLRF